MTEEQIKVIFEKHDGIMHTKELSQYGIYYRKLMDLIVKGRVDKFATVIINGKMIGHLVRRF